MQSPDLPSLAPADSLDEIARDLQALRESAGRVSYAEIVRRITALRVARGIEPLAATPPRSTVYSMFQTGRKRIDTELLRDTVVALGVDASEADEWVQRYLNAAKPRSALAPVPAPAPTPALGPEPLSGTQRPSLMLVFVVMLGAVMLNHGIHHAVTKPLDLPIYLDMVGTALAAMSLGPWHGALVALTLGMIGETIQPGIWAFSFVNVAGALVWGYGVRTFRLGQSITGFFALNLIVATVCTLIATPILVVLFGGAYGSIGHIAESLQAAGMSLIMSTFTSNIATSVIDKLLTGFIALTICALLQRRLPLADRRLGVARELDISRNVTAARPAARWIPGSRSFA